MARGRACRSAPEPVWSSASIQDAARLLNRVRGRDVFQLDETFLRGALERRREATGSAEPEAYLALLGSDTGEAVLLLASLDIHHSELFRDPLLFAVLEERVLPGLAIQKEAAGGGELRIWSAGCAAGQEACSLAILLWELAEARRNPLRFRIFATDSSVAQLELARAGVYPEAAMRNVRLRHLQRWFERGRHGFQVSPEILAHLDFSAYDLLDPDRASPPASIFGGFDLVVCCNVLFYYRPEAQRVILDKLRASLSADGYLATGSAEREPVLGSGAFQATSLPAPLFTRWR